MIDCTNTDMVSCFDDKKIVKDLKVPDNENNNDLDETKINYKEKYRSLKRKLSCLLYEQECFHEELQKVQKKCLRASRDKSFLLDRLLQFEKPSFSSSDDENTDSSSNEKEEKVIEKKEINKTKKKKKISTQKNIQLNHNTNIQSNSSEKSNKFSEKSNNKTNLAKNKLSKNVSVSDMEKVRCTHTDNGKQCTKLVSTKIKSGICFIHRQQMTDNSSSLKKSSVKRVYPPTGGKDIGQIREAMEASSRIDTSTEDEDDELVIDLP
ncbi:uncharacterized protein LOC100212329 [Hydra vulgaris]|nr:uncharacterized protein LOC100212329 [Hydra vulgaris]